MLTRNCFAWISFGLLATSMVFTGGALQNSDIDVVADMILKMQLGLIGIWAVYRFAVHSLRAQSLIAEMAEAIRRTPARGSLRGRLVMIPGIFGLDPATL